MVLMRSALLNATQETITARFAVANFQKVQVLKEIDCPCANAAFKFRKSRFQNGAAQCDTAMPG